MIHFVDFHLFGVDFAVDEIGAAEEDAPEDHSSEQFLSFSFNYLLSFQSQIVHQFYSFFSCFQSVHCEVVSEVSEAESPSHSDAILIVIDMKLRLDI